MARRLSHCLSYAHSKFECQFEFRYLFLFQCCCTHFESEPANGKYISLSPSFLSSFPFMFPSLLSFFSSFITSSPSSPLHIFLSLLFFFLYFIHLFFLPPFLPTLQSFFPFSFSCCFSLAVCLSYSPLFCYFFQINIFKLINSAK